ncbi:MAG: hypothetical protein ACM3XM_13055 [Mycobacterium leprae]
MSNKTQIPRVVVSPAGVSHLYQRNSWSGMWWSVALPGLGHLFLGQTMKGLLLMTWEILINTMAHLNLAIFHTVRGEYALAAQVINPQWAVLYPMVYIFAIIDAYRVGVDSSRLLQMEKLQKHRRFDRISISGSGVYAPNIRLPLMAAFWSLGSVGLGQLYCSKTLKAVVLTAWYLVILFKSGFSLAVYYTAVGRFDLVGQVVDYQWLLFWPSIYIFGICDSYDDTVEQNNISREAFRYRMRKYLKNEDARKGARLYAGSPTRVPPQ